RMLAQEMFGVDPLIIYCSPVTDISEFWGAWRLSANETRFQEGLLALAIRWNRPFVAEEFSNLPVEVRTAAFMGLRTERRVVNPMNGETLEIPDDFRMIFTTLRESLACRRSAESMRALMSGVVTIHVPPLGRTEIEAILAAQHPDAPAILVTQTVELFEQFKS